MKILKALVVAVFLILNAENSSAQLTLTAPTANSTLPEGRDFYTHELNKPFNSQLVTDPRSRVGWEDGANLSLENGKITLTNTIIGGNFFALFPSYKGTLHADFPEGENLADNGILHPIDASKYNTICISWSVSNPSTKVIYWANDRNAAFYTPDGSRGAGLADVTYPYPWNLAIQKTGPHIDCFDMTNPNHQNAASSPGDFENFTGTWTGLIHALRLDPSLSAPAGSKTSVDWIRIVNPTSGTPITIGWNWALANSQYMLTIWVKNIDTNEERAIKHLRSALNQGPGSFSINSAWLPPGRYQFRVTAQSTATPNTLGPEISSGYSSIITIGHTPNIVITAPGYTSGGSDFFSTHGGAVDMDSVSDVKNNDTVLFQQLFRQYSQASIVGGVFQAVADLPIPGNSESDNQLWLVNGTPIDTTDYCYFIVRMGADETNFPTMYDKLERGWVTRVVWWGVNGVLGQFSGDPGGFILYGGGMHTYIINLCNLVTPPERGEYWSGNPGVRYLRLDPLETSILTWFFVDFVQLFPRNHSSGNLYNIRFEVSDADSSLFNAAAYYSSNKTSDGTLIGSLTNIGTGSHQIQWNTSGLTEGAEYYIYVEVTDGVNTKRIYSSVPVYVGDYIPAAPRLAGTKNDFDGDGRSDACVYQDGKAATTIRVRGRRRTVPAVSGIFFTRQSSAGQSTVNLGAAGNQPVVGDFDGDGKTDRAVVSGNPYTWIINLSANNTQVRRPWGIAGDKLIPQDYDGDGKSDIAIFRNGIWYIVESSTGGSYAKYWGITGDIPVPADYDGDGKADIAIFRPADGTWWVVKSANGEVISQQFGLPGDIPVPDYHDNDAQADFAVWRQSEGRWFILSSASGAASFFDWGLSIDTPVTGDYNGDGVTDLCVYRPTEGNWYCNHKNGQTTIFNWGIPGRHRIPAGY